MINRIRDIRRQKGMTLADVAARCDPPTTAQTIGRLETGMRNLSLDWMNRIAAALGVEPELLLRGEDSAATTAGRPPDRRRGRGAATPARRDPADRAEAETVPSSRSRSKRARASTAAATRCGCASCAPEDFARLLNRDVLAPRAGGRFAFGRMIDRDGDPRRHACPRAPASARSWSTTRPGSRLRKCWCVACEQRWPTRARPVDQHAVPQPGKAGIRQVRRPTRCDAWPRAAMSI